MLGPSLLVRSLFEIVSFSKGFEDGKHRPVAEITVVRDGQHILTSERELGESLIENLFWVGLHRGVDRVRSPAHNWGDHSCSGLVSRPTHFSNWES